jgi:uncharacterized lipoprotein YehR (DUF1307 family)
MKSSRSLAGVVFVIVMTLALASCDNVGVGIGVTQSGAYYGGGTTGPGMIVGGAAYR